MLFFLACLLLSVAPSALGAGPVVSGVIVEGLHSIGNDELLYLLDIRVGDALDPERIREGIKRAFRMSIFEDIAVRREAAGKGDVSPENGDGGYALRIVVKERDRIDRIRVTGNDRIATRIIKDRFPLKEGQAMRYDLLDESADKLKQSLTEAGFPDAEVSVRTERTTRPYSIDLALSIVEGRPVIIEKIIIDGPDEARAMMKTREGDLYDQFRLRDDLSALKKSYKSMEHVNPVIGPYTFSGGVLTINVDPGLRLTIAFEGNAAVSNKELLKEIPFFEAEDFRNDLVEEAVARITALYRSRGYPLVQIAPVSTVENGTVALTVFVYEGEQVLVDAVTFSGVSLSEKSLRDVLNLKEGGVYNPDLLSSDSDLLTEFYYALGYLEMKVHEPDVVLKEARARVHFTIEEGKQSTIDAVEVRGAQVIPAEELLTMIAIEKGRPYNEVDIFNARYRLAEAYLERGFTDVFIDIKKERQDHKINIIFDVREGEPAVFGKTIVVGTRWVKRAVIERELLHREGAPYHYNLLNRERQKLYRLGLFADITMEPAETDGPVRDVLVHVREGNAGTVEFGIGYGDYENLRGFLDIGYRNLFGMNRQASLRIEASSLELRYSIMYLDPWFLDKPMPFKAMLIRENREERNIDTGAVYYKVKRHAFTTGVERKITDRLKAELFYEYSPVDTYDVKPDMILTDDDTGVLRIGAVRPGIIYDSRDNPFDPKNGVLAGVSLKIASSALLSDTDFIKLSVNTFFYREFSPWLTAAAAFRCGLGWGFGGTDILPLVERYFLGGRSSVRGYNQNTLGPKGSEGDPTGGNAFLNANLELRASLGKGLGIVTFVDGGNVWQKVNDLGFSLKYTAGVGLRYSTPVGPLRLDYGHKLDREAGESRGEFHFSIGHAF